MSPNWIFGNPPAHVSAAVTGVFTPTTRSYYWSQPAGDAAGQRKGGSLYSLPFVD